MLTLAIAVLVVVIAVVLLKQAQSSSTVGGYKARSLLTENEIEFFSRLVEALPDHRVFPQVALGALLQPDVKRDSKSYYRIRNSFAQKIADYVVCDNALNVVAVIELDDRTHSTEKDAKRDAMLEQAGYKVVRWNSKKKPTVEEIKNKIVNAAPSQAA